MAGIEFGKPFGLDSELLKKINWKLALERISIDLRSDFIYAPHLSFLFAKAGDELVNDVIAQLKAGKYSPGEPISMEVPKASRLRVVGANRTAASFSRPGSILLPRDRILYQVLADEAAPIIGPKSHIGRSFSHQLAPAGSAAMFLPTRTCWNDLQKALASHSQDKNSNYVLKIDIANYFGSLNQHKLINVLNDAGYAPSLSTRLEILLLAFTRDRSSRGILQGMFPSDLLGNYYLAPIDRFLEEYGVASARYVDDIYAFVESVDAAEHLLRELIPALRSYDLVLNESKSMIIRKNQLNTEEPDLEALFDAAVQEIAEQIEEEDFDVDYGFQSEWDDSEDEQQDDDLEDQLELQATTVLFDSIDDYPGHEENIERFCLPLFATANSDYAVQHVLASFKKRASMSQIYAAYLARFLNNADIASFLVGLLDDSTLADWQKMWILAALSQITNASDLAVKAAFSLLKDPGRHDALRAVAAAYVGKFGDHDRRIALAKLYGTVSDYVKAAIYFSSRAWPYVERSNARANWGAHGSLNSMLTIAMAK